MSIYDYLFRYDYGAFWMARPQAFSSESLWKAPRLLVPFVMASRVLRPLVESLYTTASLYRLLNKLNATAVAERFVILDAYLPTSTTKKVLINDTNNATGYLKFVQRQIPISIPIWLCPVREDDDDDHHTSLSPPSKKDRPMLINVAVWGRVSDNRGIGYVAAMEAAMLERAGRKMLYSPTTKTVEELYDHHVNGAIYQGLRQRSTTLMAYFGPCTKSHKSKTKKTLPAAPLGLASLAPSNLVSSIGSH